MNSSRTRQASAICFASAALVATILTVATSATADPTINSKRAEAQAVLAQIHESDAQLEQAIEAYNYANVQLDSIDADLSSNARHLVVARQSLGVAQTHVAERLRALYVNGDGGGAVEIILGAENLDDLLNRLDMVQRVGAQDSEVLKDVKRFRKEVNERRARLQAARADQARVVAERASQKQSIESQLAERERRLSGLESEIAQLKAEEAQHQAQLAAAARARIASQRAAASSALEVQDYTEGLSTLDPAASDSLLPAAPPSQYGGVVGIAMQYLGTPYVWGGSSPGGFDCSGLVAYVYSQVGVSLPHHAASIYSYGTPVSQSDLEPGDLVFFSGLGHIGIYIGNGQYIHAPHTGDVVKISSVYRSDYVGAKRL